MRTRTSATVTVTVTMVCVAWLVLCAGNTVEAQEQASVGSLLAGNRAPTERVPEVAALEAQLAEIERRPEHEVAATLIAEARNAVSRARTLAEAALNDQAQRAPAQRAQQLAIAALAAASHTIARHVAEQELAAARRRIEVARAAAQAAQQALATSRAQRAQVSSPQ